MRPSPAAVAQVASEGVNVRAHRARFIAVHGSEAVMLRGAPARSDGSAGGSQKPPVRVLLAAIRGGTRIGLVVGLLACFGWQALFAQNAPRKLIVQRSTRAIPHKFIVHPSEATLPVNQTQRFEVTDAEGKPVAVRWNVSGIGCSGLNCGTIDDQGVYRTPPSLPRPSVVTVEGVLVSDPNYSVLTEVRLQDGATVNAANSAISATPDPVATAKKQTITAPELGRQKLAFSAGLPPLPNAIAAAPAVGRAIVTSAELMPLPNPIGAAPAVGERAARTAASSQLPHVIPPSPAVGRQLVASAELLPLPNPIGAAPVVGKQAARAVTSPPPQVVPPSPAIGKQPVINVELMPLPNPVSAAPAVGERAARSAGSPPPPQVIPPSPAVGKQLVTSVELMPLPNPIGAAPVVERQAARAAASQPLPKVVAPSPEVGKQLVASVELMPLPNPISAAPAVGERTARSAGSPPPQVIPPSPAVGKQTLGNSTGMPPLPNVVAVASAPTPLSIGKTQPLAPTAAGRQNVTGSGVLTPMPNVTPLTPGGSAVPAQHGPAVIYQDGQLTIDAENLTLAAVLALIAEKTGAVIEVPPGSGQDRIFEHTGPGPANDVLEQLLNGTPFNFIIVSSPQHPSQPAQVLLSLKGPDTDTPSSVAAVQPKPASNPLLWTPPETSAGLPPLVDRSGLAAPKESLPPEALGELIKERGRQLREQLTKPQ